MGMPSLICQQDHQTTWSGQMMQTHSRISQCPVVVKWDSLDQNYDNPDAVYVDYDGPFDNFDAHNLAAGGIHVVKETLRLNGVSHHRKS